MEFVAALIIVPNSKEQVEALSKARKQDAIDVMKGIDHFTSDDIWESLGFIWKEEKKTRLERKVATKVLEKGKLQHLSPN